MAKLQGRRYVIQKQTDDNLKNKYEVLLWWKNHCRSWRWKCQKLWIMWKTLCIIIVKQVTNYVGHLEVPKVLEHMQDFSHHNCQQFANYVGHAQISKNVDFQMNNCNIIDQEGKLLKGMPSKREGKLCTKSFMVALEGSKGINLYDESRKNLLNLLEKEPFMELPKVLVSAHAEYARLSTALVKASG